MDHPPLTHVAQVHLESLTAVVLACIAIVLLNVVSSFELLVPTSKRPCLKLLGVTFPHIEQSVESDVGGNGLDVCHIQMFLP